MFSHRASRWSARTVKKRSSALRVLVVDDYEPGATALAAALLPSDFDVRCVFSAAAALELTENWIPDVAIHLTSTCRTWTGSN